jgi:hypothetical protein
MANLTSMEGFKVDSDASIHARPVIALKEVLLCFVDAIMPDQQISMGIG